MPFADSPQDAPDSYLDASTIIEKLEDALAIKQEVLNENLYGFLKFAKGGTCKWHENRDWFKRWLHAEDSEPKLLWISGAMASGKSVLAACITESIRNTHGGACLYHSFSYEDKAKRNIAYLFRSLAFQLGLEIPRFRDSIIQLEKEFGVSFGSMGAVTIWEKIFSGVLFKMVVARPVYCVVDGLDETDSVQPLLQCLGRLRSPTLALRILFVSRPSHAVKEALKDLPMDFTGYSMTLLDTQDDIRAFVRKAVQSSAIPSKVQAQVIDKILAKASGNFLWVSVATKTITQYWHFESSIERALNTLPNEMEPLYSRTLRKLEERPTELKQLASNILTWATFSHRPLSLSELNVAVRTDFPDIVSLESTMIQLCGDFLQMRGPKISLVHETTRMFLIENPANSPTLMGSSRAHTYLTKMCLKSLSSTKDRPWRNILGLIEAHSRTGDKPHPSLAAELDRDRPFLLYAVRTWTYHLSLAQCEDQELQDLLTLFFKYDVRNWIYALALAGDLRSLVKSAQYLKTFIKRREAKRSRASQDFMPKSYQDPLRPWAVDLGRVVGKFGNNLVQQPSSIFNLVSPFCPDSSVIKKSLGMASSKFTVTGITNNHWDDCQARLCPGPDEMPSKLLVTEEVIAAMIAQARAVQIWHAETFLPMRRIQHGEYLSELAISKEGYLMLTAGPTSLKVWEIGTGRLLATRPKASEFRVVGAAFDSNDSHVLVGYADHLIVCSEWRTGRHLFSFKARPDGDISRDVTIMSFSPDRTQVALMSRTHPVEIWDVRSRSRAYRCVIGDETTKAEHEIGLPAEAIEWHPNSERLYVLYHNTRLVDFCPISGEQTEHHMGAKQMVCSPKGSYLLTCDHGGKIRVFSLPDYAEDTRRDLRLVYQLNGSEFARDLAFGAGEQRIYDVRGSNVSCYEPDALLPSEEPDPNEESHSHTGSIPSSDPVVVSPNEGSPITALAGAPNDFGYCCGRDDGELSIHEIPTGKQLRSLTGHAKDTAIIAVAWSSSGKWIASGDESGQVLIRKVQVPTSANDKMLVWKPSGFRIEDGISQLLFSSDDKFLLVSTALSDRIWDVAAKHTCPPRTYPKQRQIRWIEHPADPARLVSINAQEAHIFDWHTFEELTTERGLQLDSPDDHSRILASGSGMATPPRSPISPPLEALSLHANPSSPDASVPDDAIDCAAGTADRRSIIFEVIPRYAPAGGAKRRRLELLRTSELATPARPPATAVAAPARPSAPPPPRRGELRASARALAQRVEVAKLVGSHQSQAVFFDRRHWLCTCDLDAPAATLKQHLFLPRDWLAADALDLCVVTAQGTLLCPRNDEVAIIRNGIHA